ncbi:LysR family transcriptional regulator [Blastococcus sp. SYSU DS0539]
MELRHLRYFVTVGEELHFNRAAQRLHIQQPPLSQQIRQLERELGVDLFVRTTRSVKLTAAGQALMDQAYTILKSVDEAHGIAVRAAQGLTGTLTIGFTGSATYALLPRIAAAFRKRAPAAALVAQGEMLTPAQVEALLDGRLDVGFGRLVFAVPELSTRVVETEPLTIVLPADHRLAKEAAVDLRDLAEEAFLSLPGRWGSTFYDLTIQACADAGFSPRIVQEVSQTATLVSFVAAGFGVALVPQSCHHITVTGAVHRPLKGPPLETDLVMAWRKDDDSPLLRRFLEIVREELQPPGVPSPLPASPSIAEGGTGD